MRVQLAEQSIHRRTVLAATVAGLVGAGLGGCDLANRPAEWQPGADPLLPLLTRTIALRDRYAMIIEALPSLSARLTPLRDAHRDHVVALARELGLNEDNPLPNGTPAPSGSGPAPNPSATVPPDNTAAVVELVAAEKTAREDAEGACLAAPGYRAALLGSIAACRASHLEALK